MGVPAFYRWLSQKYPKIVKDVIEDHPEWIDGIEVPVDTSTPNPNGMEFDNLYLDMNGIIHPCFHPEDRPAPTTETEVFLNIFDYIDRLFSIVRPRRLLYMAIDGVAPRAKMNQQRSRRFRAAQDAAEKAAEEERLRQDLEQQGIKLPKAPKSETFDSNTITPGTPFMDRLATALQYYVHQRLNGDKGWRGIEVILSDSNTPGEGEHKAMQYVRQMRGRPGWNPNTRHCVYGLDADLIMLALATHEPHFCILREVIVQPHQQTPAAQARIAFSSRNDGTEAGTEGGGGKEPEDRRNSKPEVARKPYQLLLVSVLREYLALEMKVEGLGFEFDPERILDDFVFMCFFVGNDFLPHMPTLDIREGAIELMMRVYRGMLPQLGGYLCDGSTINMARCEQFISAIGQFEDTIFQKRMRELRRQKDRLERQKHQKQQDKSRRNAAGQVTRIDESAPSAAFMARAVASGDIRAARSVARPALDFSSSGRPEASGRAPYQSRYTAAGMTAEIEREEAAARESQPLLPGLREAAPQAEPAPENGLLTPNSTGTAAPPTDTGKCPNNKEAAARLRARMACGKEAAAPAATPPTPTAAAADGEPAAVTDGEVAAAGLLGKGGLKREAQPLDASLSSPDPAAPLQGATPGKGLGEGGGVGDELPPAAKSLPSLSPGAAAAAGVEVEGEGRPLPGTAGDVVKEEAGVKVEGGGQGVEAGGGGLVPGAGPGAGAGGVEGGGLGGQVLAEGEGEVKEEEEGEGVMVVEEEEQELEEVVQSTVAEVVGGLVAPLTEEQKAANKKAADELKAALEETAKEKADRFDSMFSEETTKIRLDEEGWKERYYSEKLGVPPDQQPTVVRGIVRAYVEGLSWVMAYYYEGCASWNWFYPYHYAPFASDLKDLPSLEIGFSLGEPFSPFNQLMGVLPAASAHALPKCFRWLFTSPESPILDFYPKDFAVDMNGKRFAWQGVALLPWIDEARLLAATGQCLADLTPEEQRRNSRRMELMYVHSSHPLAPAIYDLEATWGHLSNPEERASQAGQELAPSSSKGMFGRMVLPYGEVCPAALPAPFDLGEDVAPNEVLCVCYQLPPLIKHISRLLEGTEPNPPCLTELDRPQDEPLWHERGGGGGGGGFRGGGRGGGHPGPRRPPGMSLGSEAQRTLNHSLGLSSRGAMQGQGMGMQVREASTKRGREVAMATHRCSRAVHDPTWQRQGQGAARAGSSSSSSSRDRAMGRRGPGMISLSTTVELVQEGVTPGREGQGARGGPAVLGLTSLRPTGGRLV